LDSIWIYAEIDCSVKFYFEIGFWKELSSFALENWRVGWGEKLE
jgi:hypothetical protein